MKIAQSPPQAVSRIPGSRPDTGAPRPSSRELSPGRALALPCAFALALLAFTLLPPLRQHPNLLRTFLGAGGALLVWNAALYGAARLSARTLTLEIALRKHHWVQACAQMAVLLYWGWHVRFVYAFLPLILAQLLFAYAVDSLLTWSRRDTYALGFGPFPVILSINLFLWFKPDWFHWQFVMIALGYAAKEFIRWNKDGRSAHVFNPSSFPLAVFSLALILTGTSDITLGNEIANTQFDAPHIYLVIFLAALPGQLLFGVARMTMPAVITMYAISQLYLVTTGTYLFFDSHIPLPVFLGMHLLVTDPSTAPRSESGRILFGVLYALGTLAFYLLLTGMGIPSFYDKLLPVPLMNLLVRRIDRLTTSKPLALLDPTKIGQALTARRRNLAYVALWAGIFAVMSGARGVGDKHPGQYLPFWQEACQAGSTRACDYATFTKFIYCNDGSGWACNEFGVHLAELNRPARPAFKRACDLGFSPACENMNRAVTGVTALARGRPRLTDLPIVLRGTKGVIRDRAPDRLYALACGQGWPGTCDGPSGEVQPYTSSAVR
jgi:hypothetical protein